MGFHMPSDEHWMTQAIELAKRGEGYVEPNPMVGCVVVRNNEIISSGYHQKFGEAHAEVNALHDVDADLIRQSTIYVTLEPCATHGKTPPCVDLLIRHNPARVCIGCLDPNPVNAGKGVQALQAAGIQTTVGVAEPQCKALIAPFSKWVLRREPFVLGKWAMTLDGKIATTQGLSKWITNEQSLAEVHKIRGRMDGIIVGSKTARLDNPLLTARPAGPRDAARIIMDTKATLALDSQLVQTAEKYPTFLVCHPDYEPAAKRLIDCGLSVIYLDTLDTQERIRLLMHELAGRNMTNVLVEGGGALLGSFFDCRAIDEVHIFVAPKLIGGSSAPTPIGGIGLPTMDDCIRLNSPQLQLLGDNYYVQSRLHYNI